MNKIKISIIVPIYNTEKYLKKCLDSLVNQTLKEIEVILINDGSSDDSQKIIDNYVKKYSNCKSKTINNSGQAIARNIGINEANGEYLMFVDSDDWLKKDACKKLYDASNYGEIDIVCGKILKVENNVTIKLQDYKIENEIKRYLIGETGPCAKIIKKSLIVENKLLFPKLKAYEDISIVPVWGLYANKIKYINEDIYNYLIHEGSTMKQLEYNEKLEHIFPSLENLKRLFEKNKKINIYHSELEWIYIEHLLHAASLRFFKFDNYENNIEKIDTIMKSTFPHWKNNKYYKKQNIKYKIICNLFYYKKYKILDKLLKTGR